MLEFHYFRPSFLSKCLIAAALLYNRRFIIFIYARFINIATGPYSARKLHTY